MKRLLVMILCLLAMTAVLGGCSREGADEPKKARFTIVTSFYPVYIDALQLTKNVPGVKVICLAKPQVGCLHDYQLTPENVKTLKRADLFVVNGAGMELFLDRVRQVQPDLRIVDESRDLPLLTDEDGHENPHVWVSVTNKICQIENLTGPLTAADPEYADAYRHNSERYIAELHALNRTMQNAVDGASKKSFVTMHESLAYLAKDLGLTMTDVIVSEHGQEPSPREVEECIEAMRASGTDVIFVEPQYDQKTAQTIARATGAHIFTFDPVATGEIGADSASDYLTKMAKNALVLSEALR